VPRYCQDSCQDTAKIRLKVKGIATACCRLSEQCRHSASGIQIRVSESVDANRALRYNYSQRRREQFRSYQDPNSKVPYYHSRSCQDPNLKILPSRSTTPYRLNDLPYFVISSPFPPPHDESGSRPERIDDRGFILSMDSQILVLNAGEIVSSEALSTGITLRYPRVMELRNNDDKFPIGN
jgi:hypothetical protein